MQFSHLLVPCFIGEIWTQTNWRISDLNPSIFQVFYPHFPDIPSTCSWYAPPHPYRCHLRMLRGLQAWKAACVAACHGPHGKKQNSWELLAYMAWLVVKRCFWKYNEKETTNSQFGEWTYFPKFSTFWVFLPWSFFGSKKELSLSSDIQETSGDVKEEVGFVFWLANRRKCLLTIWGMDLEKGGGGIFQHFFWKCCSWNFEWEVVFFNWMRWTTIAVKTFREGFFLKQGCLNQFGVQRIKMQILILCNGKGL